MAIYRTLTNIAKNTPYAGKWLYKKMIPQFDCTYYLALNLNSYSNILSIHIVVKSAGETKKNVGVPAPGLLEKYNFP